MNVSRLLPKAVLLSLLAAIPSNTAALTMEGWIGAVHHVCPTHHLEWYCDDCWDDIYGGYEKSLPPALQDKVAANIDDSPCTVDMAGLSCDMAVNILAIGRAGLFNDFVKWSCQHFSCEDAAICSEIHPSHHKR
jgi:hypothetical protein